MQSNRRLPALRAVVLAAACAAFVPAALAAGPLAVAHPSAFNWTEAPPGLPPGGKVAMLHGDPARPGPFVLRVRVPAGYKVPLHWHSKDESLTVLSGTLELTTRDGGSHVQVVERGGFHHVPANVRHVAYARTPTEFQVHGDGPLDIQYVDPRDDPRGMAKH